jgi:hypothetical protein
MTTYVEILPERKSSKRTAINWVPSAGDTPVAGVLTVHADRGSATYVVSEFPTDWAGRGFTFAKVAGGTGPEESYSVFCGDHGAKLCECRGFERFRYCRHTDAAEALIANGWL